MMTMMMNDFVLHGERISPKASLYIFLEDTARYKKRKILKKILLCLRNQLVNDIVKLHVLLLIVKLCLLFFH